MDREELPQEGIETFLKRKHRPIERMDEQTEIGVLGVPYDGATSNRTGARYGPRAIRRASGWFGYIGQHELHNVETGDDVRLADLEIVDVGDVPTYPTRIDATRNEVRKHVQRLSKRTFPLVLGGDHYVTYPAFVGFASTVDSSVGLVHLDAHSDTIPETSVFGEHFHGSTMARIIDSEFCSPECHAMVGIRGYEDAGFTESVAKQGRYLNTRSDIDERGIQACIDEALSHILNDADVVYATVDIDVVDPAYAPGTGTPEPGGISSRQFLDAMTALGKYDEVAALDLVEVAPSLEPADETARLAASGLVRFLESRFLCQ